MLFRRNIYKSQGYERLLKIENFKQKKSHIAILISVKVDFQMKSIASNKGNITRIKAKFKLCVQNSVTSAMSHPLQLHGL